MTVLGESINKKINNNNGWTVAWNDLGTSLPSPEATGGCTMAVLPAQPIIPAVWQWNVPKHIKPNLGSRLSSGSQKKGLSCLTKLQVSILCLTTLSRWYLYDQPCISQATNRDLVFKKVAPGTIFRNELSSRTEAPLGNPCGWDQCGKQHQDHRKVWKLWPSCSTSRISLK